MNHQSTTDDRPVLHIAWRLVFLVVIAVLVVAGHFTPGLDGSLIENGLRNSLHVIGFAAVAAVVFETLPAGRLARGVVAIVLAGAIGAIAEYVQTRSGRSDLLYLYWVLGGATFYVLARVLWAAPVRTDSGRASLRVLAVIAGLLIFSPLAYWLSVTGFYLNKAPMILDFEESFDARLVSAINSDTMIVENPPRVVGEDGHSIRVRLTRRGRSGLGIVTVLHDWSDYSMLVFDAEVLEGQASVVTVHINDYDHIGRFFDTDAGRITVTSKAETFRIPLDTILAEVSESNIDKSNMRQIVILARDKRAGTLLRIDNIHLE